MPLRLLQVGLGSCGKHWLKHILPFHQQEVELAGLVDIDPQALRLAQELSAISPNHCFTSIEAALTTVACDAVLIVTALPTHVPMALTALNAGKHVLLEKPFAPSLAEARQVIQAAQDRERILLINQNYRYFPAVQMVKTLLQEEKLGAPGIVNVDFRHNANMAPPAGNRHYTLPQPLLIDMTIHHFDLMRYILGREPLSISCQAWNPSWSNFVEPAVATATITFQDNIVVNYRGSWVSSGPDTAWGGSWQVECARGEIEWSSRSETAADYVILHTPNQQASQLDLPAMELRSDWHGSLHAFREAIAQAQEPASSGTNNLNTLALTLASVASATQNRPIDL